MPDSILETVKIGCEVAKSIPAKPAITPEQKIITKDIAETYNDLNNDLRESLRPGERYLTPAEAAERKKMIIEAQSKPNG